MYAVRNWLIGGVFMLALIMSPADSGPKPRRIPWNSMPW